VSSFTSRPGAVGDPPRHYGSPLSEQKALAAGRAIVDLSDRSVVTLTGADRLRLIDTLTTQSLARLAPGESAETLQLDQQGRVEHAMNVVDDGETTWLLTGAGRGEALAGWFDRMRFMLDVQSIDRTADFAVIGTLGDSPVPGAVAEWRDPWREVVAGGHQYAATPSHPGAAWTYREVVVPRDSLDALADLPAAGTIALEALRIAAWRPSASTEVDERTIPHELDWLRSAVHLTKGCYRGQETVAKVHNLGHPPRRLVQLHLDGSEGVLPEPGDEVLAGDKPVGRITSVALHHEDGPIALAVVKRSLAADTELIVTAADTAVAAAQEVIVPVDAGSVADVPRLPRLGAVRRG